jgi:hypothetical protein
MPQENAQQQSRPSFGARTRQTSLLAAGFICTGLAVIGVFLPVLPTVPLLLLAAACFARSSDRFYHWLLGHPRLGPIVRQYRDRRVPRRAKAVAIGLIWVTIPLSAFLVVPLAWVRVLLLGIALGVTVYILRLPNRE